MTIKPLKLNGRCSVARCSGELGQGDSLFCFRHRKLWIDFLIKEGVHEREIPVEFEEKLLKEFCR